jgi:hypothetical protein
VNKSNESHKGFQTQTGERLTFSVNAENAIRHNPISSPYPCIIGLLPEDMLPNCVGSLLRPGGALRLLFPCDRKAILRLRESAGRE